jgi:hypothetical protein
MHDLFMRLRGRMMAGRGRMRSVALLAACALALAACSPSAAAPATEAPAPATLSAPDRASLTGTLEPGASPAATAAGGSRADPFAGWLTYTDPATGYSIRYPPDAHFSAGRSAAGIYTARIQFRLPDVAGYQGMVLRVEPNPAGAGIEQVLPQLYQKTLQASSLQDLLAAAQAITVNESAGVRVQGAGGDFTIVVPYGKQVYILAPVHDVTTTAPDPAALEVFERIVESFRVK